MKQLETLINTYYYLFSLIFNFDETMLHLRKNKYKVIVRSVGGRPSMKMKKKSEHVTFGLCIAVDGGYVQLLCILPLKTIP
jgi:hypothetical protein